MNYSLIYTRKKYQCSINQLRLIILSGETLASNLYMIRESHQNSLENLYAKSCIIFDNLIFSLVNFSQKAKYKFINIDNFLNE